MTEPQKTNPNVNEPRKQSAFFWTMLGLSVLDIIMLFWLLNPLPRASKHQRVSPAVQSIAELGPRALYNGKPSPLGRVAVPRAASGRSSSLVADASRRPKLLSAVYMPVGN